MKTRIVSLFSVRRWCVAHGLGIELLALGVDAKGDLDLLGVDGATGPAADAA